MYNYEVHILISPSEEQYLISNFRKLRVSLSRIENVTNLKKMATVTTTGISKRQPMITFNVINKSESTVKNITKNVTYIMAHKPFNFNIVRVKIERLLSGNNHNLQVTDNMYFESHIKIGKYIPSPSDYKKLAQICLKYGVQLLLNPDSRIIAPVTTLRKYDTTYNDFINLHNQLVNELLDNKFETYKTHIEMGIFDSNVYTDEGWLFKNGNYKIPITEMDDTRLLVPKY